MIMSHKNDYLCKNYGNMAKLWKFSKNGGGERAMSYAIFPLFTYSICYREIYRNLMGGIICGGAYDLENNQN